MPKLITDADLAALEAILRKHPEGASMSDLAGARADDAARRAVQRRLRKLIDLERVRSTGAHKRTRYFLADAPDAELLIHAEDATLDAQGALFVPISRTGQDLQKLVRRPEKERTPVGYDRKFLARYQPNVTYFLSSRERKHLAQLGTVDIAVEKPAGTYARQILNRLLIDLSWASSKLEGNTYSILDTHQLIAEGKAAEGKSIEETQMIMNHKDAIEFLVDAANEIGFNRHTILNLHALLANNLLDPAVSGRLRTGIIGIGKSVYAPLQTPSVIEECFAELLAKAEAIKDPFEQSFFVAIQLPYLQPFHDVNKRTSRLAANVPFIKGNISPISFIDVPQGMYVEAMLSVYELNKTELARDMFIWAYERSARRYAAIQQSIGAPDQFRIRYKEEIRALIQSVVQGALGKAQASHRIAGVARQEIADVDRVQFIEAVESELLGLHEGNFARYRVRPSEFFAWKVVWERV